jgi:3-methyladenine DNA glycosylase AlkD
MLREIGKRDQKELVDFLNKHYANMPRTMLRYSIERLPEQLKKSYLAKN